MPLHLVGISGNQVWHTIRRSGGWDPWDELLVSAGALPAPPARIACGFVMGALHVCVAMRSELFHTIRFARGNWQSWGNAGSIAFPQVRGITNVDCVGMDNVLHVCVDGFTRSGTLQTLPAVWHAMRISNPNSALDSWTSSGEVTARYRVINDLACANVAGAQLHILARCTDTSGAELLVHNIRFADGTSQPLGDQDVISLFPTNANALRGTRTIAAAGIGGQLHVVASNGTELFHTIRLNDVAWQPTFGSVRIEVDATFTGPLALPACANESGNLHVCAISDGGIVHTIRLSSPAAWRNPEAADRGMFGDVLANVPPGLNGSAPPRAFAEIACAGE
jgi:hypothetical protein